MTNDDIWNTDASIISLFGRSRFENGQQINPLLSVPAWVNDDIAPNDIAAIVQGGCESGAYMPAVTYYQALQTMSEHGDDIFDYIDNALGEIPDHFAKHEGVSWSGMATHYLSLAVELWASTAHDFLLEWEGK